MGVPDPNSNNGSVIFRSNRAVGYVSNGVPAVTRYVQRRRDTLITTCIGRSFQVYTASHFRLIHVSSLHPDNITAMANDRSHIYTASDKVIYVWRAGKHVVQTLRGHTHDVHLLLSLKHHLVAVDEANILKVWDVKANEVYLEIPFKPDDFHITAIAHPPGYINKIVLGSRQGKLQIWNISTNTLIYTLEGHSSRVTCIEPAPGIDFVGVGHQDGTIRIVNLRLDELRMEFKQDWGSVSRISFRTDGPEIMATSCSNGYVAFWDLNDRKVTGQLKAHDADVSTALCFNNEPLLLTTSPDNSMKLWIFDVSDGGARLLRIREGHTEPPRCIRFHGNSGTSILSAGEDSSLRVFCTLSESLNKSMGKASYNRKASKKKKSFQVDEHVMPPIIEFAAETARDKEWDNIVAIHAGIIQATTWSFHKNRMGAHRLVPPQFESKSRTDFEARTTCLTVTHCGNFVIIGYDTGNVERFNIQSGAHRASYPARSCVRGIASDNLNKIVVSGGSDGILRFFPFNHKGTEPCALLRLRAGVELMRTHNETAMVAVGLVNFTICILDLDTKTIIRKFEGHTAKINDITFSHDSRWLISASMDSTIKVWDIPTTYMIDHFRVERPCVSLTMSPTGDFLATAHVDVIGLYLWANKALYGHISFCSINPLAPAPYIGMPSGHSDEASIEESMEDLCMTVDDEDVKWGEEINTKYESPHQLSNELITLSGLPASRWQNLLNLDTIKKRNKPKAPPKAPKEAPFFLPTVSGPDDIQFDVSTAQKDGERSRVLKDTDLSSLTPFGKLMEASAESGIGDDLIEQLKNLGPSMVVFEIKSLHPLNGGSVLAMKQFLKMIEHVLKTNRNYELAQSYLGVFLKSHGASLKEYPDVIECLQTLQTVQEQSSSRIEKEIFYNIGVVSGLMNFAH